MSEAAGTVIAVCLGPGGIPKRVQASAQVTVDGLVGDGHRHRLHGGKNRAVCLFSSEDYASLRRDGVACDAPGSFGENLLIEGLDFAALAPGQKIRIGEDVVLEIHDVREPCTVLRSVDKRFPALMEGRSGFVCKVQTGGTLAPGNTAQLVS